jgi:nucleotide-binding universal stress UspA family protein
MTSSLFYQILAPTDGSKDAERAARLAFRLAKLCGAQVTILYVVDATVVTEMTRFSNHQPADVSSELQHTGRQYLHHLQNLARQSGLTVQHEMRQGEPHTEIVALANGINADLIVMGHVGQRGPRRILIGSVTERVLEFARCPVLVVKA